MYLCGVTSGDISPISIVLRHDTPSQMRQIDVLALQRIFRLPLIDLPYYLFRIGLTALYRVSSALNYWCSSSALHKNPRWGVSLDEGAQTIRCSTISWRAWFFKQRTVLLSVFLEIDRRTCQHRLFKTHCAMLISVSYRSTTLACESEQQCFQ